jgi:hypothetical protein
MEPFYSDHNRLDERSLALHQLVAEKVRAAPALLDKARENVRRLAGSERKRLARFGRMGADSDIPRQPGGRAFGRTIRAGDASSPIQPVRGHLVGGGAPSRI